MNARRAGLHALAIAASLALLTACATTRPVDKTEPRRLVGADSDVRVDVQVFSEQLAPAQRIPITYDVTNNRNVSIGLADLLPDTSYDPESQLVTVSIGAEVPGMEVLPRIVAIPPGQTKTFSAVATVRINLPRRSPSPYVHYPNAVRVKLSFLNDLTPFTALVGIPERAVRDAQLASQLFPKWVEHNEALFTNTLPMRWVPPLGDDADLTRRKN